MKQMRLADELVMAKCANFRTLRIFIALLQASMEHAIDNDERYPASIRQNLFVFEVEISREPDP